MSCPTGPFTASCPKIPLTLTGPITITCPGYYCLQQSFQQSILGNPNDYNVLITIDSSDVYLDLCGNTLTGAGLLSQAQSPYPSPIVTTFVGNSSNSNVINVTSSPFPHVSVGEIIYVGTNPTIPTSGPTQIVSFSSSHNTITVNTTNTFPAGTQFTVSTGIVNDTRVDSSQGINIGASKALDNITVANGKLQYFTFGAVGTNSTNEHDQMITNVVFKDLTFDFCGSVLGGVTINSPSGGSFVGPFWIGDTKNLVMKNIRCYNSISGDIHIVGSPLSANITIENFQSYGLRGSVYATFNLSGPDATWLTNPTFVNNGVYAASITVSSTVSNLTITGNTQISNIRTLASLFGIFVTGDSIAITIKGAVVDDIANVLSDVSMFASSDFVYGYELRGIAVESGVQGTIVEDCIVSNISSVVQKAYSFGYNPGIPQVTGNDVAAYNFYTGIGFTIRNCTAVNITSAGKITAVIPSLGLNQLVSDMIAAGFFRELSTDTLGHDDVFENCSKLSTSMAL